MSRRNNITNDFNITLIIEDTEIPMKIKFQMSLDEYIKRQKEDPFFTLDNILTTSINDVVNEIL